MSESLSQKDKNLLKKVGLFILFILLISVVLASFESRDNKSVISNNADYSIETNNYYEIKKNKFVAEAELMKQEMLLTIQKKIDAMQPLEDELYVFFTERKESGGGIKYDLLYEEVYGEKQDEYSRLVDESQDEAHRLSLEVAKKIVALQNEMSIQKEDWIVDPKDLE